MQVARLQPEGAVDLPRYDVVAHLVFPTQVAELHIRERDLRLNLREDVRAACML
jgi:hypothetical protein